MQNRIVPTAVLLLVLCATVRTTAADNDYNWASSDYAYATRQLDDFFDRTQWDMVDPNAPDARAHRRKANARKGSTVAAPRAPKLPQQLAAAAPAAQRAQLAALYQRLFEGYQTVEQKLGVPPRDVAGALATYLGAAYAIYRNVDVSDAQFRALVQQMRDLLAVTPGFTRLSAGDKQDLYERLAIVGMLLATQQHSRTPAQDAELRALGKRLLEELVHVDAGQIELGASGLTIAKP